MCRSQQGHRRRVGIYIYLHFPLFFVLVKKMFQNVTLFAPHPPPGMPVTVPPAEVWHPSL